MDAEWYSHTITAVGSVLTTGTIIAVGNLLYKRRKLVGEQKIADSEQPFVQLVKIVTTQAARMEQVEKAQDECRKEHTECMRLRTEDAFRFGKLEGQLDQIQHSLADNTRTSRGAKRKAIVAETKANIALDQSQAALISTEPPLPKSPTAPNAGN